MDIYESRTLVDEGGDVAYVPYVTEDGRVGYVVKRGTEVGYIYLNPSRNTHDDQHSPDVFVYGGPDNNPVSDDPLTFVLVEQTMLGVSAPCPSCGEDRPHANADGATFRPGTACPSCGHVEPDGTLD